MSDPASVKPRRRWWTLSLRSLILLVLISGAGLGWKAARVRAIRRAIAAVETDHGLVFFDYQYVDGEFSVGRDSWIPRRVRNWLGDEFFHNVTAVHFYAGPELSGDKLAPLKQFGDLKELDFSDATITDSGMAVISAIPSLRRLEFFKLAITDASLASICKLSELRFLRIYGASITDAGLAHVGALRELRHLDVSKNAITDVGLAHIGKLRELRNLNLAVTKITDAGLAHLVGLEALESLDLTYADVKGNGLAQLANLPKLTELKVKLHRFTDEGVNHLNAFKKLKVLHFSHESFYCENKCHPDFEHWTNLRELATNHAALNLDASSLALLPDLDILQLDSFDLNDQSLKSVQSLKRLKILKLGLSKVTDAGVAKLTSALPSLKIEDHYGGAFRPRGTPSGDVEDLEIPEALPDTPPPKE